MCAPGALEDPRVVNPTPSAQEIIHTSNPNSPSHRPPSPSSPTTVNAPQPIHPVHRPAPPQDPNDLATAQLTQPPQRNRLPVTSNAGAAARLQREVNRVAREKFDTALQALLAVHNKQLEQLGVEHGYKLPYVKKVANNAVNYVKPRAINLQNAKLHHKAQELNFGELLITYLFSPY